ncbi:YihY/virulence factor BrkB family protein [Defluviimonas sp. WL0024]|uniref:YihY/virulence factor BrkB family protein n=2 Tax=Albidovulum TaxID=205889 RepID=A0ABT3J1C4_9RHOB|nr:MULTISPECIES: YihY/virulence factor BrkB family protein [Defluviimonas]MCU9848084.1 YihY/virulence factor BrkB family protein [Defluviimonas sp. WL0024]MCW3781486.1 YihY/virulence factor BrkB family protein [Defluviimonas salinarum]
MATTTVYIMQLILAVWNAMDDRHLGLIAAGVAFYMMFALFPGMAATIAIWGFFSDPAVMREYLGSVSHLIPAAAYGLIEAQLNSLLLATPKTLGWTTAISLAIAFYSIHNGVAALISGLNAIHVRRHRPGLMRWLVSIGMTFALIAVFLTALATVVMVPVILNFLELGPVEGFILRYLPWTAMFLVVLIVLGLFYRWGPTMDTAPHSWITPGGLLAAILWAAASMAFSVYLENFGAYNRIYGSIGAAIALLMWLYISAFIVLLGAAVNEEHDRLRRLQ